MRSIVERTYSKKSDPTELLHEGGMVVGATHPCGQTAENGVILSAALMRTNVHAHWMNLRGGMVVGATFKSNSCLLNFYQRTLRAATLTLVWCCVPKECETMDLRLIKTILDSK